MGQRECQSIKYLLICGPKISLIHARFNLAGFWCGSFASISFVWPTASQKNNNASICTSDPWPLLLISSKHVCKLSEWYKNPFNSIPIFFFYQIQPGRRKENVLLLEQKSEVVSEKYEGLAPFQVHFCFSKILTLHMHSL